MSMEKQNNKRWVTRLESLEAPLSDRNVLWERLHSRTTKKKNNIPAYWYAAAATIVALFCGLLYQSATNNNKQTPVIVKQVKPATLSQQQPMKNDAAPDTSQRAVVKTIVPKHKKTVKYTPVKQEPAFAAMSSPAELITPVHDTIETTTAATALQPPRKKLRVVHINRLDNYIEQKTTKDYFTSNTRDGIIKIKLSPSN